MPADDQAAAQDQEYHPMSVVERRVIAPLPIDNFARHTWFMFGLAVGIALTALTGWVIALTFLCWVVAVLIVTA